MEVKNLQTFLNGLAFSPGRYTLSIVGSYWDTYEGAKSKSVERHTETFEIQETITAPQSVILFGAALGGLIAFILLTKLQPTNTTGWSKIGWLTGSVSAILLSTIVTILIARLSQNQFIISVSVNDLWGAIAVGFMVTVAGPAILRKFSNAIISGAGSAAAAGKGASIKSDASPLQAAMPDGNAPESPNVPPAVDQDKPQSSAPHKDGSPEADSAASVVQDVGGHEELVEQSVANRGTGSNNGKGN